MHFLSFTIDMEQALQEVSKKSKKIPPKKFGSTFLTLFLQTGCQLFHFINNQFVSLSSFRLVYLKHAKSLRIF